MTDGALAAIAAALRSADRIVIGSHVDPDGDAVGSSLGLAHILDALGADVSVVAASGSAVPSTYAFLPGADRYVAASSVLGPPDVFVALDSPDPRRLGDAEPLARSAAVLVVIDHHPDAQAYGHLDLLDPAAAATGCLVWSLARALGVAPGPGIATCLYAAVLTDTGRFSYANTTAATLRSAAEMIEAGAVPHQVAAAIYENRSAGAQELIGRTLSRIAVVNDGRVAYSWIDADDLQAAGARPEETENLIDHVRALGGIDVAVLAKSGDGTVRCSLRAKGDVDVGAVARAFGGGGHRAAAGFTFAGTGDALLGRLLPMLPGGGR